VKKARDTIARQQQECWNAGMELKIKN